MKINLFEKNDSPAKSLRARLLGVFIVFSLVLLGLLWLMQSVLLEKYYDEDSRCYSIRTKHYGVIQIAPPTVGVVNIVKDWAINRTQNNKQWDQSIIQMIPFFRREWRQLDDKAIFNLATEYRNRTFCLFRVTVTQIHNAGKRVI